MRDSLVMSPGHFLERSEEKKRKKKKLVADPGISGILGLAVVNSSTLRPQNLVSW